MQMVDDLEYMPEWFARRELFEKNRRCTHRYFPIEFLNVLIYVLKAGGVLMQMAVV